MYGIFAYIYPNIAQMLVNIPYMEHLGIYNVRWFRLMVYGLCMLMMMIVYLAFIYIYMVIQLIPPLIHNVKVY